MVWPPKFTVGFGPTLTTARRAPWKSRNWVGGTGFQGNGGGHALPSEEGGLEPEEKTRAPEEETPAFGVEGPRVDGGGGGCTKRGQEGGFGTGLCCLVSIYL